MRTPEFKRRQRRLTANQRRFITEFLKDFDAKNACLRADLSEAIARHYLRNPKVLRALRCLWRRRVGLMGREAAFPLIPVHPLGDDYVPDFSNLRADPLLRPLTARQLRFIEEYMKDYNADGAAKRAGYVDRVGWALRNMPNIRAELGRRGAERAARLAIAGDRVLAGLAQVAFTDARKVFAADPALAKLADLDEDIANSLVVQVKLAPEEAARGTQVVLKYDKPKALSDLARYIGLKEPERAPETTLEAAWKPLPGPQTTAWESEADIIGFGGAAGGGKTDLACGLALMRHQVSHIFRREATQHDAIVDRIAALLGTRTGFNGRSKLWMLDGGRRIIFGSAAHSGDEKRYQGRPKDLLVLDEAANFLESQARFLMGWVRSTNPEQKCTTLLTFNPPTSAEGRWVIEFFAPWLDKAHPNPAKDGEVRWFASIDGDDVEVADDQPFVLDGEDRDYDFDPATAATKIIRPVSRTFIASRLADNPHLAETGYMATLQAMPEPLRSQMLEGDFAAGVEDDRWQVIPTAWVDAAMARWSALAPGPMDSMGVDVARGGRDKTIIARRHGAWVDNLVCLDGPETPDGPTLAGQVIAHRRDAAVAHIDVVGWGSSPFDFLRANGIQVVAVNGAARASGSTRDAGLGFVNLRAEIWWRMREALDPVAEPALALPLDPALKADLCAPRWKQALSGIQIEAKEEIIRRIGRSPDRGDAVCMALMKTPKVVERRERRSSPGGSWMG